MTRPLRLPQRSEELAGLARDLQGFTVDQVAGRVGERAVAALDREDPLPALLRAAGGDPLGVTIRLFLLGGAVSEEELDAALPRSAGDARAWGIVTGESEGEFRAGVDLRPTTIDGQDVWLAADLSEIATGQALPADHVLGLGGASATLVDLTVRTPVARALDLGTGSGIQALGLTGHAEHIIATDISSRALAFAGFNLALAEAMAKGQGRKGRKVGFSGTVELHEGSFFEPVDGDFDLIVSNPPFVVSPRSGTLATYTYRDGGFVGDGVVQHLIEHLPTYLRPGGVAQMLANWEVREGEQWDTRIGQWVRAAGVDAWIIQREFLDPAHYVHTWIRDGGLTPERDPRGYREGYLEWLTDFDARGVAAIAFGYIILRKPETPREPWVRLEEITGTLSHGLGETLARTLTCVETLARTTDEELLAWRVKVPGDVTEERYYRPGATDPNIILLRQGGGFARAVQVDTLGAGAVGASEGELTLGQICAALAHLVDAEAAAVAADVLPTIRGLLTDGLLLRASGEKDTLNS